MAALASWPPAEVPTPPSDQTFPDELAAAQFIHERKMVYLTELATIDKIATMLAAALDRTTSNFDVQRFMRIVTGDN